MLNAFCSGGGCLVSWAFLHSRLAITKPCKKYKHLPFPTGLFAYFIRCIDFLPVERRVPILFLLEKLIFSFPEMPPQTDNWFDCSVCGHKTRFFHLNAKVFVYNQIWRVYPVDRTTIVATFLCAFHVQMIDGLFESK